MKEIKLGELTFVGERDPDGKNIRVMIRGEVDTDIHFVTFAEWQSLVNIDTVLDAAHRTLQIQVDEIRRLDFLLAAERAEHATLHARLEKTRAWATEKAANADGVGDGDVCRERHSTMTFNDLLARARTIHATGDTALVGSECRDFAQAVLDLLGESQPCGYEPPVADDQVIVGDDHYTLYRFTPAEARWFAAELLRAADEVEHG